MDFELGVELTALRRRARDVALAGVAEHGAVNDSWINGYSRGFSRTLAAEGWIGMTWPTGHGGDTYQTHTKRNQKKRHTSQLGFKTQK